jgi:hypothetical protein
MPDSPTCNAVLPWAASPCDNPAGPDGKCDECRSELADRAFEEREDHDPHCTCADCLHAFLVWQDLSRL